MQVNGQTEGLKKGVLGTLQSIYDMKIPKDQVLTDELINVLAQVSCSVGREISVMIDRKGNVLDVSVGDSTSADVYPLMPGEGKRVLQVSGVFICISAEEVICPYWILVH